MRPMQVIRALWYGFVALIPWLLLLLIPFSDVLAAHFERAGDLRQGRDMAMAATLPDGRVLVTGGVGLNDEGWGVYLATSELFDPATNAFVATGAMRDGRDGNATLTPLSDGRVLITGGIGQNEQGDNIAFASAEVYDPATGLFAPTANKMSSVRYFHTATLLADGRVLVTGGWGAGERLASADVYDPATNRFTRAGDMAIERNSHTATLLADGRVLIAGGLTTDAEIVASAEVFDPVSGHFTVTGSLAKPRFMATASLLEDGRVLVGGGMDNGEWRPVGELYDPSRGQFDSAGSLHWARSDHAQTTLPDGRVLLTAGGTDEGPTRRAERFDPVSGRFTLIANMALGRARAATAMLPDGRVLVAGGNRPWEPPLAIAEVYTPTPAPYADLALEMRSSSATVPAGGAFHYLLSLQNRGTIAARDGVIDVELPQGVDVRQIKIAQSGLSGTWRCDHDGAAVSCTSQGVVRPNPNPDLSRPALAIRIDATAPAGSEWPLFATALAGTSTNEDITANNEADAVFDVVVSAKTQGIAARKPGGKTQPSSSVSRVVRDAISGVPRSR